MLHVLVAECNLWLSPGLSRGSWAHFVGTIHSKFLIIASQILRGIKITWGSCYNASSVGRRWGSRFACLISSQVKPMSVVQGLHFESKSVENAEGTGQEMKQLCSHGPLTSLQAAQQKAAFSRFLKNPVKRAFFADSAPICFLIFLSCKPVGEGFNKTLWIV